MAIITKPKLVEIINRRPENVSPAEIVAGLRKRGFELEGFNQASLLGLGTARRTTTPRQMQGFLGKVGRGIKSVGKFLTSSERGFGETIGQAAVAPSAARQITGNIQRQVDFQQNLIEKIKVAPKNSVQQTRLLNLLKGEAKDNPDATAQLRQIIPAIDKKTRAIIGEAAGVALDIVIFGKFGKAATGAKSFVPAVSKKTAVKLFDLGFKKGIKIPFTQLVPKQPITKAIITSQLDDMALQASQFSKRAGKIIRQTSIVRIKTAQDLANTMLKAVGKKAPEGVRQAIIAWSTSAAGLAKEAGIKAAKLGVRVVAKRAGQTAIKTGSISTGFKAAEELKTDKDISEVVKSSLKTGATVGTIFGGLSFTGGLIKVFGSKASDSLKMKALKQFQQGLGATTKTLKAKAEKVSKEALKRGIKGSKGSLLRQAEKGINQSMEKFEALGNLKGRVATKKVVKVLDRLRNSFIVAGKNIDPQVTTSINKFRRNLTKFGKTIDSGDLRKIKQIFDRDVVAAGGKFTRQLAGQSAPAAKVELERITANRIRQLLAKNNPKFAAVNKEYSFFKGLDEVIDATIKRTASQQTPLGQRFAQGIGFLFGAPSGIAKALITGKVLKTITKLTNSTFWRTTSAVNKQKIADKITKAIMTGSSKRTRKVIEAVLRGAGKIIGEN